MKRFLTRVWMALRSTKGQSLVEYALFLLREVMPQHDELCFEEGQYMSRYVAGDESARKMLSVLKGRTKALFERYWAM